MRLQEKVQAYINQEHLFTKTNRLLIALSGGGDSMALLHLMKELDYSFEVAHVNFHLRGEASNRDEALVKNVCKQMGLKLHLMEEDTELYAVNNKCSIEMAARDIRYAFFDKIMNASQLDYVLVAHHQDDVVETFFINLMRGTGLSGLTGMDALRQRIVRPLLTCTHQELLHYLDDNNWPYCTDHTNYDTAILRNKLRHDIIPDFEERKPAFRHVMQRTIGRLKEAEKLVVAYAEQWKAEHCFMKNACFYIEKQALYDSASVSELLYRLLQPYQFSPAVIDAIAAARNARTGARFYSENYVLTIDRDALIVAEIPAVEIFTVRSVEDFKKLPLGVDAEFLDKEECKFSASRAYAYFDVASFSFPLTLRRWQQGDVFYPFGMNGKKKKVSDFFIDEKLSQSDKEHTWLLCQGEDVMWIVGWRSDHRFRVGDASEKVLRLCLSQ